MATASDNKQEAYKNQDWEKRLRWLAGNPKTPEQIAKDLTEALHELDRLRSTNE